MLTGNKPRLSCVAGCSGPDRKERPIKKGTFSIEAIRYSK